MVQGEVATEDIVFGSIALAILLASAVVAGAILSRFRNRRFRSAWEPLRALLSNTKISGDGGGASTSWMSGSFHGRPIHASMTPGVARSTDSALKGNRFSIIVPEVQGRYKWSAQYAVGYPLVDEGAWTLQCEDDATQQRLEHAGIVEQLQDCGVATVRYSTSNHQLVWEALIEPFWVLPPEHFVGTAEMLLEVADTSASLNR